MNDVILWKCDSIFFFVFFFLSLMLIFYRNIVPKKPNRRFYFIFNQQKLKVVGWVFFYKRLRETHLIKKKTIRNYGERMRDNILIRMYIMYIYIRIYIQKHIQSQFVMRKTFYEKNITLASFSNNKKKNETKNKIKIIT